MLAKLYSASTLGTEAYLLEVEVDVSRGLPSTSIVGLPDTAVKESRDRVKSALTNCGYEYPLGRITINLAPADIKKEGPAFDLPIALGILACSGKIPLEVIEGFIFLGELSLDGRLRSVKGVLPIALSLRHQEIRRLVLPIENANEAAIVKRIEVYGLATLIEVIAFLSHNIEKQPIVLNREDLKISKDDDVDFSEVKGQYFAKRALEVAAAGFHNVLMVGPPGSGKTMLAQRFPTILPSMSEEEILQTTKIYSIAGLLSKDTPLILKRPFRVVHHTTSDIALVGGGQNPKPGEISLAHNGVLFMDELPEFRRDALEVLRQPMETGKITVSRANKTLTFLSRFLLIAAMNPCPCGYYGSVSKVCRCSPYQIQRYRRKISGPLLDRIDIHLDVPALAYENLVGDKEEESSSEIQERVERAWRIQVERFKRKKIYFNSQMNHKMVKLFCEVDNEGRELLKMAIQEFKFSARSYVRILKVARTIADLDKKERIEADHLAEAVQYRSLDKEVFMA